MTGSAVKSIALLFAIVVAGCRPLTDAGQVSTTSTQGPGHGGEDQLPGLYTGYDAATVPHWAHLRMQMTDYRIQYLTDASARSTEYAWSAQHFDRLILDWGDTRSVPEYRRLAPRAELYRYVLSWTAPRPSGDLKADPAVTYYAHMREWYTRHTQYRFEDAFLHDATRCGAATKSESCRLSVHIWKSDRWVVNPADAGLRAYHRERLAAVAADADGLFIDEHASGDMVNRLKPLAILEYPDWSIYERDVVQLLREVRGAVGAGKRLLLNTHTYVTPWDAQMTAAAGGAHVEAFNNPVFPEMEGRWRHVETVLGAGASINMPPYDGDMPAGYTAGNFDTPTARRRVWELASYYLVAPAQPGLLFYNSIGDKWDQAFATRWIHAVAANVGLPLATRRVVAEGTDGAGRRYRVWGRDYHRALVLVRPVIEWGNQTYGTETAVEIGLPANERFRPLGADGRVTAPVDRIALRAGEAAILIKEGRVPVR